MLPSWVQPAGDGETLSGGTNESEDWLQCAGHVHFSIFFVTHSGRIFPRSSFNMVFPRLSGPILSKKKEKRLELIFSFHSGSKVKTLLVYHQSPRSQLFHLDIIKLLLFESNCYCRCHGVHIWMLRRNLQKSRSQVRSQSVDASNVMDLNQGISMLVAAGDKLVLW